MSRLVSRILLAIFMFPLAAIFYIFVVVSGLNLARHFVIFRPQAETTVFAASSVLTWGVVAAYWCLLWKTTVRWNKERVSQTWFAVGGACVIGGFFALLVAVTPLGPGGTSFGVFVGGMLAIVLWLIATVFIWRETPAERAQRLATSTGSAVACPACGYNLTGLRESRCPECGSTFTLDELLASQPTQAEIE